MTRARSRLAIKRNGAFWSAEIDGIEIARFHVVVAGRAVLHRQFKQLCAVSLTAVQEDEAMAAALLDPREGDAA